MRQKHKRGRPPRYVLDGDGKPVVGLSCDDNGYYNTHYRSEGVRKEHFGTPDDKFDIVLYRFYKWQSKRDKKKVRVDLYDIHGHRAPQKAIQIYDTISALVTKVTTDGKIEYGKPRLAGQYVELPEEVIVEKTIELFSKYSPSELAHKLGIPELANLYSLKALPKSLTLQQIGQLYLTRQKKPLRPQEYEDSERWWNEFCHLVSVKTVRDVTIQAIRRYQDSLYATYTKENYSSTWLKHRFDKIKTILKYALKSDAVEYTQDIEAVLTLCKKFVYPDRASVDPKPIGRDDFLKILAIADTKQKAILLLAANAALYPQDVSDIKKRHIDLKKKHLVMDRGKTGVPRVACLWNRTVRAIRVMQKEDPHNSEYLFITFYGKPYCSHGIGSIWRTLRGKTDVDHSVKFEHIRDACQTAGVDADCSLDEVRFLLGHRVHGVTDNYLKRRPNLTQKACNAIEQYFFGKKSH